MAIVKNNIDIQKNPLREEGILLDILLLKYPSPKIINLLRKKHSKKNLNPKEQGNITRHNIIWATDAYEVGKFKIKIRSSDFGKYKVRPISSDYAPKKHIKPELVTDKNGLLIQPRASKSKEEQLYRTKDKAEVFTPLDIVKQMNQSVDTYKITKKTWQKYVKELKLEITCGEAPYIVSRYDPTSDYGEVIDVGNRVGFLDMKLRVVSKYAKDEEEWLYWAEQAFKASYGYEWQGDNVLLARENLLYTLIDYYQDKFKTTPSIEVQEEFAIIISWNIFQMDGLRYVIPMSCNHNTSKITPSENRTDGYTPKKVETYECEGCKYNRLFKHDGKPAHNGKHVKIMDWEKGKVRRFVDIVGK